MKAHRTDRVSLGFGLVFLAVAGWWLASRLLDLPLPAVGWFLAGGLIVVGVLGTLAALRSARGAAPDEPVTGPPDDAGGSDPV